MVDSHCHLALCEREPAALVAAAREEGVVRMLTVGIDVESSRGAIELARSHPEVRASAGHHPNGAASFDDRAAAALAELASDPEVAAVGETGLDFYRDRAPREAQRRAFAQQIEIARAARKPLVIHVRDGAAETGGEALAETFATLAAEASDLDVVLHCFSASAERAREAAAQGWHISFAGNLTYPSAGRLREAAVAVPDELLLVETDAPFLAPQARRGEPNQPAFVGETARALAAVRGVGEAELEALVETNAARLFGW